MFLLGEIMDETRLSELTADTPVDFLIFKDDIQAMIYAEPDHADPGDNDVFIVDEDSNFFRILIDSEGCFFKEKFRQDPTLLAKLMIQHYAAIQRIHK